MRQPFIIFNSANEFVIPAQAGIHSAVDSCFRRNDNQHRISQLAVFACSFLLLFFANLCMSEEYMPVWKVDTARKVVALTFDDGPKPEYSLRILDLLDKYGIKATFFVVGREARLHPDIIYRMASTGHDVGDHTYTHRRLDELDVKEVRKELTLTNQVLQSIIGTKVRFFRPPGGRYNKTVLQEVNRLGMKTVNWSVNAGDYTPYNEIDIPALELNNAQQIIDKVVTNSGAGDILLFHNGGVDTEKALPIIIEELRSQGFSFITMSELLQVDSLYKKEYVNLR